MKKVEIGKHVIEFYDSADSLPIKRFQKFNKHLMIDNEVGSTFEDFLKRDAKIMEYLKKEMWKEAVDEMGNKTQTAFNLYKEYSPKEHALAIMVYSIDGEVMNDYSSSALDAIIKRLDEMKLSKKDMDQTVSEVKKKSTRNWLNIFRRNSKKRQTRS
jgi:chemotaxis protein CheY-P-specific phosphatase CheC